MAATRSTAIAALGYAVGLAAELVSELARQTLEQKSDHPWSAIVATSSGFVFSVDQISSSSLS